MLKNGLILEQKQQLVLNQSLIQFLNLLQLGNLELAEYINQELLENPALEEYYAETDEKQISSEELNEKILEYERIRDEEHQLRRYEHTSYSDEYNAYDLEAFVWEEETLQDYLMSQLNTSALTDEVYEVAAFLIENIDTDGYLKLDDEDERRLANLDENIYESAKNFLKTLDPPGVGARNLRECLLWQLDSLGVTEGPLHDIADKYLDAVARNRITDLARTMHISSKNAQNLVDIIKKLEPFPARNFKGKGDVNYIVPDIIIEYGENDISLRYCNNNIPELRISSYYKDLLSATKTDGELYGYLSERISSAEALIRNIKQRRDTVMRIASVVVSMQGDFLEKGEGYLKPMLMRDVAEILGIHESTVSRAVKDKYIQGRSGIYEMRKLFSSGIDNDNQISTSSIRLRIKTIIENENPNTPYSDQEIVDMFEREGITIARRTVAKYRESLGIASSFQRKRV